MRPLSEDETIWPVPVAGRISVLPLLPPGAVDLFDLRKHALVSQTSAFFLTPPLSLSPLIPRRSKRATTPDRLSFLFRSRRPSRTFLMSLRRPFGKFSSLPRRGESGEGGVLWTRLFAAADPPSLSVVMASMLGRGSSKNISARHEHSPASPPSVYFYSPFSAASLHR